MSTAEPESLPFLVVGLGNPGAEFAATPHNFGFMVVDELAGRAGIRLRTRECQSLTARGQLQGRPIWLAQPLTYMNLSGDAIAQLLRKLPVAGWPVGWIVICDELDLPFGTLRLRERGSAGSHNGLRSIVTRLGTTQFARLRLGIGPSHPIADRAAFVLDRWSKACLAEAEAVVATAADVVEMILSEGIALAMTRYNAPAHGRSEG